MSLNLDRFYTRVNEQWPNARYLALCLAFAWVDILLFSPTVFPASGIGNASLQGMATLLSTIAMFACTAVLALLSRRIAHGSSRFFALSLATAFFACASAVVLYLHGKGLAPSWFLVAGSLLSGTASAGLFVCTICMVLRSERLSLFDVCVNVGMSRIWAGFVFFFVLSTPEAVRVTAYLLLPFAWLFFMRLDRHASAARASRESKIICPLDKASAVSFLRLLLLLGLIFFVASLPQGSADATNGLDQRLVSGQMVMVFTMTLCAVMVGLLVLCREKYRSLLTWSFYIAGCILLVVFMSAPFPFGSLVQTEWIASSFRNLVDVLSLMLLAAVVRKRGLGLMRSVALFYLAKFAGCLLGLAAAIAIGHESIVSSLVALVVLLFLIATVLLNDMEVSLGEFLRRPGTAGNFAHGDTGDLERDECVRKLAQDRSLSQRETEVFGFLCQGYSAKVIAEKMVVSPNTVKTHMKSIYAKLGVSSRDDLLLLINEGAAKGSSGTNASLTRKG